MPLTQTQLADELAERVGSSRADAKNFLTALEDVILDQISAAEKVKIDLTTHESAQFTVYDDRTSKSLDQVFTRTELEQRGQTSHEACGRSRRPVRLWR